MTTTTAHGIIYEWTGKPAFYWMNRIGKLCREHSYLIKGGKGLQNTHSDQVMGVLAKELYRAMKKYIPAGADPNILTAQVMGLALCLWAYRVARAKSYDPRRRIEDRQMMLGVAMPRMAAALMSVVSVEAYDLDWFPDQQWDNPWHKDARYEPDEVEMLRQEHLKKHSKPKGGESGHQPGSHQQDGERRGAKQRDRKAAHQDRRGVGK